MNEKIAVMLLIDGVKIDILNQLIERGELPNIEHIIKSGSFDTVTSTFPTTTGCAHLPFLTGKYTGECNIPGGRWKEDTSRTYFRLFGKDMNDDCKKGIKTLYDYYRSANVCSPINRRASFSIPPIGQVICHLTNKWTMFDGFSLSITERLIKKDFDFIFTSLYAPDELSHRNGCFSSKVIDAYKFIDKRIGRLERVLKENCNDYLLILVSDHGITDTHTHIDLLKKIKLLGYSVQHYPYPFNFYNGRDVFVGESGNSMANITLNNKEIKPFIHELVNTKGMDLVIHKGEEIRVFKGDSEAILHKDGDKFKYEIVTGDPLGIAEYSNRWMDSDMAYNVTFDTQYPDSVVQILQLFESSRAGDIVVTSENGFDLRKFEIPEHRASHGSLNREHMLVPVITNLKSGPMVKRTKDVFGIVRDYISSD
jgi:hypothetical protein